MRADVELGGTDQRFNLLLGRDGPDRLRSARTGDPHDAAAHRDRWRAQNVEVFRQPGRGHRSSRGDVSRILGIPDASLVGWYSLLLGGDARAGVRPRDAKRALARGAGARRSRRGPPRRRRKRRSTGSMFATSCRRRSGGRLARRGRRRSICRPAGPRVRLSRRPRRAGGCGGRSGSTAGRWPGGALDLPAGESTAGCCSSESDGSPGCACAAGRAAKPGRRTTMAVWRDAASPTPGNGEIVDVTEGVARVLRRVGCNRGW